MTGVRVDSVEKESIGGWKDVSCGGSTVNEYDVVTRIEIKFLMHWFHNFLFPQDEKCVVYFDYNFNNLRKIKGYSL